MNSSRYELVSIGVVHSALINPEDAPRQGDEGAPEVWLELAAPMEEGLAGLAAGDELIVLTWLHKARRDLLQVHPRGNMEALPTGVFATRAPHRPNPIGLHRVSLLELAGSRMRVAPMEAVDGTPVLDIKPVLGAIDQR
jgi:tRNA-Thr(GGU) m(6)t(6)A37 methyltransferase TsaA